MTHSRTARSSTVSARNCSCVHRMPIIDISGSVAHHSQDRANGTQQVPYRLEVIFFLRQPLSSRIARNLQKPQLPSRHAECAHVGAVRSQTMQQRNDVDLQPSCKCWRSVRSCPTCLRPRTSSTPDTDLPPAVMRFVCACFSPPISQRRCSRRKRLKHRAQQKRGQRRVCPEHREPC